MANRKPLPDWARSLVELSTMQARTIHDLTQQAVLDPNDRQRVLQAFAESHALLSTLSQMTENNEHAAVPGGQAKGA